MKTDKLFLRLKELTSNAKVENWNGGFIKKLVAGDQDKTFQCNKKKYKIEMFVECTCDNSTRFVPSPQRVILIDWRNGRNYRNVEEIAQFLDLTEEQVQDIYQPMIERCVFSNEDIEANQLSFIQAMANFREAFCL